MKLSLAVLASLVSINVFAADEPKIKQRTEATGAAAVVADSVTPCTAPAILPQVTALGYATVESKFGYLACKEYVTVDVEVTGSTWNTKSTPIAGTERKSHRLERVEGGQSFNVYADKDGEISLANYYQLSLSASQACANQRTLAHQGAQAKTETPCADMMAQ